MDMFVVMLGVAFVAIIVTFVFLVSWTTIMILRKITGAPQNQKINKVWIISLIVLGFSVLPVLFYLSSFINTPR